MHMSFRISLTVPTKRPMCKINVYPKLVIEWFPNPRDLFALRDRVRRNKDGVYRGILHQFGRLIVPPCHIVNFTGSFIRLALFIYINPVFLDYNNEKHLVFFRVENQPQAAEDNMNKILDQLVEDKYGYSMRDSDSSTYEKTAGWEKEYVNGFMEEAKSGKYDFVFVCQTESVIDEMDRRKIPYIIVEPDNIVWNKQEAEERAKERQIIKQQWFGRFVLRNNSHIKDFSKWLSHMKDIYDERTGFDFIAKHNPVSFFVLKQNQDLSDIIDDLYWKKQHCDAYIV